MALSRENWLFLALAGAVGLLAMSRTRTGQTVAADAVGAVAGALLPRGLRNNNPGNIRYLARNPWRGQVGNDGGYGIYDSAANGVRAIAKQLMVYERRGLNTVRKLIATWAPSHENPTDAYVVNVSRALGVGPDDPIAVGPNLPALAAAIIRQENGQQPYSDRELTAWVYLA